MLPPELAIAVQTVAAAAKGCKDECRCELEQELRNTLNTMFASAKLMEPAMEAAGIVQPFPTLKQKALTLLAGHLVSVFME
jgi:hypothetical protein